MKSGLIKKSLWHYNRFYRLAASFTKPPYVKMYDYCSETILRMHLNLEGLCESGPGPIFTHSFSLSTAPNWPN